MDHRLLIGSRGWDHPAWAGTVYPQELPAEWRFCYYSNEHRGVLVPSSTWDRVSAEDVAAWAADCDPDFGFVHELPGWLYRPGLSPAALAAAADRFLGLVAPLGAQTRALVARGGRGPGVTGLRRLLGVLEPWFPVAVEGQGAAVRARARVAERIEASTIWRPEQQPAPEPAGSYLVVLVGEEDLRRVRAVIETAAQWMDGGARGGAVFFVDPPTAYRLAREARLVAELLGV